MSFGEGDLHGKVEAQARRINKLMETNGKLCAEINRQERRIRELEDLVRDMDRCLRNYMSCDQCEILPCRIGERVAKLALVPR